MPRRPCQRLVEPPTFVGPLEVLAQPEPLATQGSALKLLTSSLAQEPLPMREPQLAPTLHRLRWQSR